MNQPTTFEIAKLLKEKGFNKSCIGYYVGLSDIDDRHKLIELIIEQEQIDFSDNLFAAPTIAEVVMWLYEKRDIWITVNRIVIGSDEWEYGYEISYLPKEFENRKKRAIYIERIESFKDHFSTYSGAWGTPTEAYLSAITHTLNNLL